MKNYTKKSRGILIITFMFLLITFNSCGVTKTVEKCDTEKKECCSKK
tara:strand:+ start:1297 stop:1437 length:141 start_codon:yes stop_codon:yes gene_type:complete